MKPVTNLVGTLFHLLARLPPIERTVGHRNYERIRTVHAGLERRVREPPS